MAQGCAAAAARKRLRYKEVAPKHRLKGQPAEEGSAHRWTNALEASAATVTSAQGAVSRTRSNGSDRDRTPTPHGWTRVDDLTTDLDSGPHGGEHHTRSVQPAQTPPGSMCREGCREIAERAKSLKSNGILINVSSDQKLIEVINRIAPEHLELNIKNYKNYVNRITNAGSIFLGKYSTEAVGDYLAGTNHVLPTAGSAKFSSGLSVYDFYKRISYINLSKKGIETLGPSVITLANYEGLEGHAKSVKLRIRRK